MTFVSPALDEIFLSVTTLWTTVAIETESATASDILFNGGVMLKEVIKLNDPVG